MSISRNYAPQTIGRPNTLSSGGNLRSDNSSSAQFFRRVEKTAVPALKSVGKYAAKGIAKTGTSTLKTLGQGVGLAAGIGAASLAGQPELLPYAAALGGTLGGEAGKYLERKANRAIDRTFA